MDKNVLREKFYDRHIGPDDNDIEKMLDVIGVSSLQELIEQTIPKDIFLKKRLNLGMGLSENDFLQYIRDIASKNKIFKTYIGMGYHPVITPPAIIRNILENPGWYTQYTPYQAEISQGRLEALINFQTLVSDMTGMKIANASLLDESTAAAEAMTMCHNLRKGNKLKSEKIFISDECFPQTIDVIRTRAVPTGIEVETGNVHNKVLKEDIFAILVQYPTSDGEIIDYQELFEQAKSKDIFIITAADLLSLALLKPPGEMGADIVIGSTQRFGVPMSFGGPHAAYFATRDEYKRHLPGRIIGVSIDAQGNTAYRMALQTREQHIRREKATSNICTAQVLLAIIAGMYAVYHGAEGIKKIAQRIKCQTETLNKKLKSAGYNQVNKEFFDTLKIVIDTKEKINEIRNKAELKYVNFRYGKNFIGISLNEKTKAEEISEILSIFTDKIYPAHDIENEIMTCKCTFNEKLKRTSAYLQHPVFKKYRSETDLLRYLKSLENKDLSLTSSMIPLGSCTMKLNAAAEMMGITYPEFTEIHPFAPVDQVRGYMEIIEKLEKDLSEITGFSGVSLQPNSGAQGEFTGLMVIRQYHISRGDKQRNVVLIPSSAHGTNPASAVMAGMEVSVVNCDEKGNIDIDDLKKKTQEKKEKLAALMVTYPSTHGVFEENIKEIIETVHNCGGQVYMDGANMNAQVGLTSPFEIGADVCHLNLHKTFAIPHGGGGPGVGPIAVAKHLVKFLPGHPVINIGTEESITAVSSAPFGSAGVILISLSYIMMMGEEGLRKATETAILNANYIKSRLEKYYKVLYTGEKGRVAHELIFDMRDFKHSTNIEVVDIAKRLMDYGLHAPTVSFPVPGTLMVEPTESEPLKELDRFCEAMISIRKEIEEIETGKADKNNNILKNSPHTAIVVCSDEWNYPYSRMKAAYPAEGLKSIKFWPSVSRINDAYGDRNLICTCPDTSDFNK
ncbi:MAG: aminomethyl-transferring glycine dehydrogenase [Ignavibacteria bacterium]|nr:aminomethyl-transferring glycine dehydrogenase [Ignavibacteria bacterium]